MKAVTILLLCFAAASASRLSPVTRIVELLKGLADTAEKEGKKEEDLYETFVCWGKSVIDQKTASNAAAASRTDTLETYIADLESGRIELTSERADLEKEIGEMMSDLEEQKAHRKKENEDFMDASAEMTQALNALKDAIDVLDKATKDNKQGVFLAMRTRLSSGMESYQQHQSRLKQAVKLGEKFLAKADATFLKRLLLGDVPKADWKKLNRKATFKMAYKARSFKIQDVLKKMKSTFQANLDEATQNEADAKTQYDKLTAAKESQLKESQTMLAKSESETGARGQSKQEASDEVKELKEQVSADTKFIAETKAALEAKKKEWKVRSDLRAGEIAAISKAIYILHNDDARDNFKKSFESQDSLFFLQVASKSSSAAGALRTAAKKSGDSRLLALAKMVDAGPSEKDKFKPILAAIDKMIIILNKDAEKDLEIKEQCEKNRMADTRKAAVTSREIDDMTDTMTKLEQEIAEHEKEIQSKTEQKEATKKELDDATKIRKDENAEWKTSDAEDKLAAETVLKAKDVLANFYKENGLALVQKAAAPAVEAGEAPPPPPSTWDGDYGGKTGESMGIIAIMEMVHEDIEKDRAKGKAEEDEAQARFDKFEKASDDEMATLARDISTLEGLVGRKGSDHVDTKKQRATHKGELDALLEKMAEISPNCEYFAVNYKLRFSNRNIEIDGLQKAKAILEGGTFAKPADPNREMKPGDAFLQKRA